MEELRSTEVLDKEIREDARKKSERILNQADEKVQEILNEVSVRVQNAREEAEKASSKRVALHEKNVTAALPLEKQRLLVSYIQNSLYEAINESLEKGGEKKRLSVIRSMVEKVQPVLGSKKVKATVVGMEKTEAEKMLKEVLSASLISCETDETLLSRLETLPLLNFHDGVILVTEDGSTTCRLTLDEKIRSVMDSNGSELASALFCGRIPE